jgi:hypothetical protein
MLIIIRERRVNLRQRQMRILKVHLLRTGAVGELVSGYFDDFDFRPTNPRYASLVYFD